jgi:dynein heavy chain
LPSPVSDSWLKVQATWLYLEPIFSSEDITKQMPEEASMFRLVDGNWRRVMAEVVRLERVSSVTLIPNLLKTWQESNALLDKVQKGLNQVCARERVTEREERVTMIALPKYAAMVIP